MQKWDKFTAEFSVHGLKYIFGSHHSKVTRIFWIFSVLISIGGFFYYLHPAWLKLMFEPEILIKTRERSAKEFPRPAITICPNIFAAENSAKLITLFEPIKHSVESCEIFYSNLIWCAPLLVKRLNETCPNVDFLNIKIVDRILKSSLNSTDIFFQSDLIIPHKTVMTSSGPCYTFNSLSYSALFNTQNIHDDFKQFQIILNDSEDNSNWSSENGLKLASGSSILPLDHRSFYFYMKISPKNAENVCLRKSFRIFLHKPNEIVWELHEPLLLNYNETKTFRITAKSRKSDDKLRNYPPESRKCFFENEKPLKFFKTYSKLNCEWECKARHYLNACGCVTYYMLRDNVTKICDIHDLENCVFNAGNFTTANCECYPACNDLTFEVFGEALKIDRKIYDNIPKDWTISSAAFSIQSEVVEEIENFLAYKIQNFISDFGGLLGLFMGCSLLSIVEIFYFILIGFKVLVLKIFKSKLKLDETWNTPKIRQVVPVESTIQGISGNDNFMTLRRTINDLQKQIHEIQQELRYLNGKIRENDAQNLSKKLPKV